MKICITVRLTVELEALLLDDNVAYRPDLTLKGPHAMRAMLSTCQPDALITASIPDREALAAWRAAVAADRRLSIIQLTEGNPSGPLELPDGVELARIDRSVSTQPHIDAFVLAEAISHRAAASPAPRPRAPRAGKRVIIVGGGIVNLVTAYELAREGYQLEVLDAGPDPAQPYDWRKAGCTFGGGDARIFSLNESRHHHHKGLVVNAETNTQFQRTIADDGWLACTKQALGERDRQWIAEHETMPQWLSGRFERDIISFNQESHGWWRALTAEAPRLFLDVGFHDGLLRIYPTSERYERARHSERNIGAILRELDVRRMPWDFPSLAEAVDRGQIAGALEVVGFSLNIQRFSRALISHLADRGASFRWNTRATAAPRDELGRITGIEAGGELRVADHYVLSPGAYGRELLHGFASQDAIAPVVGMWITLPNTAPKLDRPIKVARSGFAATSSTEGANVIAGWDPKHGEVIYISGGHGYVGIEAAELDPKGLADLTRAVDETARRLFPSKYARAVELGMITDHRRFCIRPWTASGLGLFERAETAHGGLAIIAGGHNTGGFAQSPSVARAIVAALRSEHHPMHELYHPRRYRAFAGRSQG
jgi:D-amino-acid dehydrogenase